MNKAELVNALRELEGLTIEKSESILDTLTKVIAEQVLSGDDVKLLGFGRFYLKKHKARAYRNPQNGKEVLCGPKETICFKQLNLGFKHRNAKDLK